MTLAVESQIIRETPSRVSPTAFDTVRNVRPLILRHLPGPLLALVILPFRWLERGGPAEITRALS